MSDSVNHPSHYTDGKIEVADFIVDKDLNFCRGNVVKYVSRAGKKDPEHEIQDLEKAVWYLQREIQRLRDIDFCRVTEVRKSVMQTHLTRPYGDFGVIGPDEPGVRGPDGVQEPPHSR